MTKDNEDKTGIYKKIVHKITIWAKPYLYNKINDFIKKSVAEYASDVPRFAGII